MLRFALTTSCLFVAAVMAAVPLSAQDRSGEARDDARPRRTARPHDQEAELEGIWPTRTMTRNFLNRMADEMADHYEMDDDQIAQLREILQDRIPRFMDENRRKLQPLFNKFIEAQWGDEAPSTEFVTEWASQTLPLMGEFKKIIDDNVADMRTFLTEDQQKKLDGEVAAFETGFHLATTKIENWSKGGYDPEVEWTGSWKDRQRKAHEERVAARKEMSQARESVLNGEGGGDASVGGDGKAGGDGKSGKTDKTAAAKAQPKDEWAQYVEDFIKRFDLKNDQQAAATRALEKRKQDRLAYLKRARVDETLDQLEKQLKSAKSAEDRKAAKEEWTRINQPIDRIFQQLKDDLEKIPTRSQRQKAEAANPTAAKSGERAAAAGDERTEIAEKASGPSGVKTP